MAEVAGELPHQVKQHAFEGLGVGTFPMRSWPSRRGQVVSHHDGPAALALSSERVHQLVRVSPSGTYHRSPRSSPHGSATARPSKPHSSQRSSTYVRCLSSSSGVHPEGSRLCRCAALGSPSTLLMTRDRK